jgi:hypothetical protein
VFAGHRDSFFSPLRDVRVGDDVFAETPHGRVHYRVTSLRVVKPQDVSVLDPTDDPVLTLITCYPFWVLGPAPDRFVVRAVRVADQTVAAMVTQEPAQEPATARSRRLGHPPVLDDDALVRPVDADSRWKRSIEIRVQQPAAARVRRLDEDERTAREAGRDEAATAL